MRGLQIPLPRMASVDSTLVIFRGRETLPVPDILTGEVHPPRPLTIPSSPSDIERRRGEKSGRRDVKFTISFLFGSKFFLGNYAIN